MSYIPTSRILNRPDLREVRTRSAPQQDIRLHRRDSVAPVYIPSRGFQPGSLLSFMIIVYFMETEASFSAPSARPAGNIWAQRDCSWVWAYGASYDLRE